MFEEFRKDVMREWLNKHYRKEIDQLLIEIPPYTAGAQTEPSFERATDEQLEQLIDLALKTGDKEWFLELTGQFESVR